MSWMCEKCSTYNDDSDDRCIACDSPRPAAIKIGGGYTPSGSSDPSGIKYVSSPKEEKSKPKPKPISIPKPTPEPEPTFEPIKLDSYASSPKEEKSLKMPGYTSVTSETSHTTSYEPTSVSSTSGSTVSYEMKPVEGRVFDYVISGDTDQFLDNIAYYMGAYSTRIFYALVVFTLLVGFFTQGGIWFFGKSVIPGIKEVFSHMGVNLSEMREIWAAMRHIAAQNLVNLFSR